MPLVVAGASSFIAGGCVGFIIGVVAALIYASVVASWNH